MLQLVDGQHQRDRHALGKNLGSGDLPEGRRDRGVILERDDDRVNLTDVPDLQGLAGFVSELNVDLASRSA